MAWVVGVEWLGWRGAQTLLHTIPHLAGLGRDPLYNSFPCPAQKSTTIHLTRSGKTCWAKAVSVGHNNNNVNNKDVKKLYSKVNMHSHNVHGNRI